MSLCASQAFAYTPESPEVKKAVDRALAYLSINTGQNIGERALVALVFVKAGRKDHAVVTNAVRAMNKGELEREETVYPTAVAIMFLCEMEDQTLDPLAQSLVDLLIARQKPFGGFGYRSSQTGDVSQNQYAAIALWTAKTHGLKVSDDVIINCLNWTLRVQDTVGGWPYQGRDTNHYRRETQAGLTPSVSVGGLAALFVLSDALGLRNKRKGQEQEDTGFSPVLKTVEKEAKPDEPNAESNYEGKIDKGLIEKGMQDGTNWLVQNHRLPLGNWTNYYLYGVERCESFRDAYNGKIRKQAPWYDAGVKYLLGSQDAMGTWTAEHSGSVSASLACLFLLRSTEKAIAKVHKDLGEGVLSSGKGLPTDVANASVKRGKVIDSTLAGEVDDVVSLLDDPDNPELSRYLEGSSEVKMDADLTKRKGQINKLREAVSAENWEARLFAVRALGRARDLESVPQLLYAMSDPDLRIVLEADQSLRFISRKFKGVGLPSDPKKEDILKARQAWRQWYLTIRPDAQFIE